MTKLLLREYVVNTELDMGYFSLTRPDKLQTKSEIRLIATVRPADIYLPITFRPTENIQKITSSISKFVVWKSFSW